MTGAGIKAWAENEANAELIASYRADLPNIVDAFIAQRQQLLNEISLKALILQARALDEAIENDLEIPLDKLVKLSANADDRTGLGRQETRVNMNLDLGARLDKAKAAKEAVASARAEGNVVKFVRRF
jgi:hypothetical protein